MNFLDTFIIKYEHKWTLKIIGPFKIDNFVAMTPYYFEIFRNRLQELW